MESFVEVNVEYVATKEAKGTLKDGAQGAIKKEANKTIKRYTNKVKRRVHGDFMESLATSVLGGGTTRYVNEVTRGIIYQ